MSSEIEARKAGTGAVFTRASETYDRIGPRFFSYFGQRLVELADIKPGYQVLDIACGRGASLFPALAQVGSAGYVTGIDLSEGMIQKTATDIVEREITNARVLQMDAEQLSFPDNSFDIVLCGFGLFFFPQLSQAISEIYRVLKPGGLLAATSWGESDERWSWIQEAGCRPKSGGGPKPPAHRSDTGWLQEILEKSGFISYQLIQEDKEFFFSNEGEWWDTEWSHGARSCFERMQPEALERARELAFNNLHRMKQPGGIPHLYRVNFSLATRP